MLKGNQTNFYCGNYRRQIGNVHRERHFVHSWKKYT
jgi:hypothetical protein